MPKKTKPPKKTKLPPKIQKNLSRAKTAMRRVAGTIPVTPTPKWFFYLAGLAALAYTIFIISLSLRSGRLSAPPNYDDVNYMIDAAERYEAFEKGGVRGVFNHLFPHEFDVNPESNPNSKDALRTYFNSVRMPHAPLTTVQGFVAFLLFGLKEWAPYLLNCIWIFLLLQLPLLLTGRFSWFVASLQLWLLAMPLARIGAHEYRPDFATGVLNAFACVLLLRRPQVAGIVFALALLSKPTLFPFTLALAFFACTLVYRLKLESRSLVDSYTPFFIGIALAFPYFFMNSHNTIVYIIRDLFAPAEDAWWKLKGGFFFHAGYYLFGEAGRIVFSYFLWPLLLAQSVLVYFCWKSPSRNRMLYFVLLELFAYLIPSVSSYKSYFFGLTFSVLFATIPLLLYFELFPLKEPFDRKALIPLVTVSVALLGFRLATVEQRMPKYTDPSTILATDKENEIRVMNEVMATLEHDLQGKQEIQSVLVTTDGWARRDTLTWYKYVRKLPIEVKYYGSPPEAERYARSIMPKYTYFIASTAKAMGVQPMVPGTKIADDVLKELKTNKAYKLLREIPDGYGENYYVFKSAI